MTAAADKLPPAPKHLVLVGAGHAHVQVLARLAQQAAPGLQLSLITPHPRQLYGGMLPGFVAGHYALDDCAIALEPLVQKSGARWLTGRVTALDATSGTVSLDDGSALSYDWLSVSTLPVQDRDQIELALPGAREHGLFVRPLDSFGALWPRVAELAQTRPLRVAVMGGAAAGIELAMAIRHRLKNSAVTLITGGAAVAASYPSAFQQRVMAALKSRNITVLTDTAVGIQAEEVQLGSGARLACDVPVIASGAQLPSWLARSGLALDQHGFIAVDACQRSTSHANVFAADEAGSRGEHPLPPSAGAILSTGSALAATLAAVVSGSAPKAQKRPSHAFNLLSCGNRYALASWGNFCAEGHWVWFWKNWMDRGLVRRYQSK